jgi:hypothetical protein
LQYLASTTINEAVLAHTKESYISDMVRGTPEKETLRVKAGELVCLWMLSVSEEILTRLKILGKLGVQLATEETSGQNDFKYEKHPSVCGVVVDKGSERGFVQVSGGNKETTKVETGRGEAGFTFVEISDGQTCMLYGQPTVLFCSQT